MKNKPVKAKRLMEKYSKREKNRDACHKTSRPIVNFAKENGFGVVMEDLKGLREETEQEAAWCFRRLQFFVSILLKAYLLHKPQWYLKPIANFLVIASRSSLMLFPLL